MKDPLRPLLLAVLVLLPILSCGKASPVAPSGSLLTITANPSSVPLNGTSIITIVGSKPNGTALNTGTEVRLTVDRGSIEPVVKIEDNGRATATFHADARSGAAKITAATGADATGVSTTVQVGLSSDNKPTVIVSASPSTVAVNGSATVTVIARNSDGSPAPAGNTVILTTTLGTLSPAKPLTTSDGTATSTLHAGAQAGTATISAVFGSSDAGTTTLTIRDAAADMLLSPSGTISIPSAGGSITFSVFVSNTQGQPFQGATVTFSTDGATATYDNNTNKVITDTSGSGTKTLTFTSTQLAGVKSFSVTASTPRSDGSLISRTTFVNVTQ